MTWEIALGVIALAGFVMSIAAGASKLAKTMGVLENTIKVLRETISEFKHDSNSTHEKIFDRLNEDEKTLTDHEGRIQNLERRQ